METEDTNPLLKVLLSNPQDLYQSVTGTPTGLISWVSEANTISGIGQVASVVNNSSMCQVGKHFKMGLNVVPLKQLTPEELKVMTLDLLKNIDPNDAQNEKSRGQIVLQLVYKPFTDEEMPKETEDSNAVVVHEAQDLEGKHHTNPQVRLLFRGEERRTKPVKKSFSSH
ncbi:Synaptotagmin-2 [Camellia lanceoleosa]|uniref:Synaptotagmin-2 n=1 Tax=Camellia lanceoleosa TaxID=1840588 RepID=A0ACC0G2P3_9ERIC|nr:Synaptotagmin-2 [Camellia lanceoleosa]